MDSASTEGARDGHLGLFGLRPGSEAPLPGFGAGSYLRFGFRLKSFFS